VDRLAGQVKLLSELGDSGGPVFYHTLGDPYLDLQGIITSKSEPSIYYVSTLTNISREILALSGQALRVSNN
jgi:hypothetical protein